jgi:uncharacterized protein (UPF0179 family)
MSKFEAIQKKLAEAFNNFEAVSQIELNPSPEICITDYKGQSYIIVNIQLSESQCLILDRKTEKTIDFDKAKIFKIINAQTLGFIPIDGKTGLLGFGDSHCDFIFFDNQDFCFVEFKVDTKSPKKVDHNRKKAVRQLGNTINLFDQKLENDYQQFNLEAYVCTPDFYPKRDVSWETLANDFLEKYGIDLFETREKFCRQIAKE